MAKKSFDLGSKLADVLNVSVPDTGAEQIVRLPLEQIDADERNFYSVDAIDALAANIELVGLLDPIRVREDPDAPGRYRIVSGHRRSAALRLLAEEDPEKWSAAPCIVEAPAASPELQELRLIYANADTRRMTSAELSAQAERVEQLLYQLKEQGMDFPGRMRDHVAEACKVSATKLAELKVIRGKLIPNWRKAWEKDQLAQDTAYKLARLPQDIQIQLFAFRKKRIERGMGYSVSCGWIDTRTTDIEKVQKIGACKLGGECIHKQTMIERGALLEAWSSSNCAGCCVNCWNFGSCKDVCPRLKDKQKQIKADKRADQLRMEQLQKERERPMVEQLTGIWRRWDEARRAAKKTVGKACEASKRFYNKGDDENIAKIVDGRKELGPHDETPYNYMRLPAARALIETADLFGVSTDYLLGRTDAKDVYKGEWISVDDRYPEEGTFCLAFTKFGAVIPSVYWRASFMDFSERSTANKRLERVERWMRLPPPPDGKKYTGQETLEGMMKK